MIKKNTVMIFQRKMYIIFGLVILYSIVVVLQALLPTI